MNLRRLASLSLALLALPVLLLLAACNSLQSIEILPAAGTTILTGVGQTVQFTAVGTGQMGSAAPTTSNITDSVVWSVSNSSVATIDAHGLATAVGAGQTQVMAQSNGTVATSDLTVNIAQSSSGSGTPYLTIVPNSATDTFIGETTQFLASGSLTGGAAQNLTGQVQWISSNSQVATISSSGLATATGAGTTTITAYSGGLTASATVTVAISTNVNNATLAIIPATASATFQGETTQFIAIGTLTGGMATTNLTNDVAWSSSDVSVATIDQAGLATAQAINQFANTTTITAIGTTSSGSLITATATLESVPGSTVNLPTLAVYEVGLGTGTVTSSPGTLDCGSSAPHATCTNDFVLGTLVTLTATPASGSTFAGWSVPGCGTASTCTVTMSNNETVGAIFNQ